MSKKQKQIDELKGQIERMQERIDQLEASRWVLPQPYPVPYPLPITSPSPLPLWPTVTDGSTWEVTPESYTVIYGDTSLESVEWVVGNG